MLNAFSVTLVFMFRDPGLSLRSNPGLELANASAFYTLAKLHQYPREPSSTLPQTLRLDVVVILTITDMPGRSRWASSGPGSRTIFTGMR